MSRKLLSVGLLVLALAAVTVGTAGVTVAQDTSNNETDLTDTNILVEDLSPGDSVVADVEFNGTDTGTVSLLYESTQTLNFTGNTTVDITAGGIHDSGTVEATASDLNGTNTYWSSETLNVSFDSVNGSLEEPETLNLSVALTGVSENNVSDTSVSRSGGSGLFSGVGGESTTQTLIIFGAVVGGLWLARRNEVI